MLITKFTEEISLASLTSNSDQYVFLTLFKTKEHLFHKRASLPGLFKTKEHLFLAYFGEVEFTRIKVL
jgi:hypothetical protein